MPLLLLALTGCLDTGNTPLETAETPAAPTNEADEILQLAAPQLDALAETHGMANADDLAVLRVSVDDLDTTHIRLQQTLQGVPVFGAQAILHTDAGGATLPPTDDLLDDVDVDTIPGLDAEDAVAQVVDGGAGWAAQRREPLADLWVLRRADGDHLTWRVRLWQTGDGGPSMPVRFIDAHSGEAVWQYDNLQTSGSATGSGTTDFYGSVSFKTYQSGSSYYLEDTTRKLGTYSFNHGTSSLSYLTDSDDSWTSSTQHEGVDAMYAATKAWDYYSTTFGRSGMDGANGPGYVTSITGAGSVLTLGVKYDVDYVNAYWDGAMIVVGSGDGTESNALTTLDILGHELTHAVSDTEVGFTYANESGAVDEALSDIFGSQVERYTLGESTNTWMMGEATWTPSTAGDALRYMNNPTADGVSYDYYSERYTGSTDNGGVHTNSGIANLAFYLLAAGGSHPRHGGVVVSGIGADAAAAIWYRAMTTYMTASTTFSSARTATLSAASDLYGATSSQYAAVQNAWYDVGVGAAAASGGCASGSTAYTGTLSATGSYSYKPSTSGYMTTTSGTQAMTLTGPAAADFDLTLYKRTGSSGSWSAVATATGSTSTESLSYAGSAASYRVKVSSYSGGGSFTLCLSHP